VVGAAVYGGGLLAVDEVEGAGPPEPLLNPLDPPPLEPESGGRETCAFEAKYPCK
jgi:hypothetical protein